MTTQEIIAELLKRRVIVKLGDDNYAFPEPKTISTKCLNLPNKYVGLSGYQAMQMFFIDAGIPSFSGGSLNYALKTSSASSIKIFLNILKDPSIDFRILVDRTSQYFKSKTTVKPSMSKYFTEGLWEIVYNTYDTHEKNNDNTFWL